MTTEVSKADATELSTRRARIRSVHHQEAGSWRARDTVSAWSGL